MIAPQVLALIDSVVDAAVVVDSELNLIHANSAFARMVGVRERRLRDRRLRGVCHELLGLATCDEGDGCLALRSLRQARPIRHDEVLARKTEGTLIVSAIPLVDENGVATASVEIYRDVTAESRMQARYKDLLEKERQRNEVLQEEVRLRTSELASSREELESALAKLLRTFREEVREISERITDDLMALEEGVDASRAADIYVRVLREAHTLKGSAASVELEEVASLSHAFESLLIRCQKGDRPFDRVVGSALLAAVDTITEYMRARIGDSGAPVAALQEAEARITTLLSGGGTVDADAEARAARMRAGPQEAGPEAFVKVERENLSALERDLGKLLDAVELGVDPRMLDDSLRGVRDLVDSISRMAMSELIEPFRRSLRDHARKRGVEVVLEFEGDRVRAPRDLVEGLRGPLVHLLRNAVDHGVEPAEERIGAGKPSIARIRIETSLSDDSLVVRIADDGRGVDGGRIREVAVSRGLIDSDRAAALTNEEAIALLWMPGFSTARTLTDTSGRGIGLDSVKETVEGMGGTIRLDSQPSKGTAFTIDLPAGGAGRSHPP